jgi:hypothetical protein
MKNNRLFEPGVTSRLDSRIVSPLMAMSLDGFPNSAAQTSVFADTGQEDTRVSAVEVYDQIIETIREVLAHMEKTEDLAAIVEALRIVLRTEEQAGELIEKLRNAQGGGIFAPAGRDRDDKEKAPKKGDRDRDRQRDGKKQ